MIEDVYEPIALYHNKFRDAFAENTRAFFKRLVDKSGIDIQANVVCVKKIRTLEEKISKLSRKSTCLKTLGWISIILAIGAGIYIGIEPDSPYVPHAIGGAVLLLLIFFLLIRPAYKRTDQERAKLTQEKDNLIQIAWAQMAPLNALYDWDITASLIELTVPRIKFDPYFTQGRLDDLYNSFGWDDSFNDGRSVICSQSGEINGNPFVIADLLEQDWSLHTYTGTRTIFWQESISDGQGHRRLVTRSQTLVATIQKPIPTYSHDKILIYGNDAAPNLTFTRQPSDLSKGDGGFWDKRKLKREIKKLEKFSQNLDDDSQYTIMANREFEALFHATDRNNEIEFRLLFTPLAQIQMLQILRDKTIGYGDDFSFIKRNKINAIRPAHLALTDLNTDPRNFFDYDFMRAQEHFFTFNTTFFKSTYFALAPCLSIPLYQQTRTHENIYKNTYSRHATFWEFEQIANYIGDKQFAHPKSVTDNILKTQVINRDGDTSTIAVTAHGFYTVEHTEIVSVIAINGRCYDVPVKWLEYLPITNTSTIRTSEWNGLTRQSYETLDTVQEFLHTHQSARDKSCYRRSIVAF